MNFVRSFLLSLFAFFYQLPYYVESAFLVSSFKATGKYDSFLRRKTFLCDARDESESHGSQPSKRPAKTVTQMESLLQKNAVVSDGFEESRAACLSNQGKTENNGRDDNCADPVHPSHFRQSCNETKFIALSNFRFKGKSRYIPPWAMIGKDGNVEMCDFCHCYVCDKPAKECQRWSSSERSTAYFNHCHATDSGPHAKEWNKMRQLYKEQSLNRISQIELLDARDASEQPVLDFLPAVIRVGAFSPTDHRASPFFNQLTRCRKCGWYSNAWEKNPDRDLEHYPADWCHACGRVASDVSLTIGTKCQPYQPEPSDVYLGTKTIPFRIKAHDPRRMKMFQKNWVQLEGTSPEWMYDEAEAEEEMFQHRLGTYPSLEMILGSIPIMREDLIPTDGSFPEWSISRVKQLMAWEKMSKLSCETSGDDDSNEYTYYAKPAVRAEDTDAILMDRNGVIIFQELNKFDFVGVPQGRKSKASIAGDIMAKWNREERCGEFVVRIFFHDDNRFFKTLGPLLGAWVGVEPFPLHTLGRSIRAYSSIGDKWFWENAFPPFQLTKEENAQLVESAQAEMQDAVTNYNKQIDLSCAKLSLHSSNGDSCCLGGICPAINTFAAFLRRYFAEILPDQALYHLTTWSKRESESLVSWKGRAAGITSHHRVMYNTKSENRDKFRYLSMVSFLQNQDIPLAFTNLAKDSLRAVQRTTTSINGILVHLENLGHEEAPFVEGLNVELLPFQRQTLQWALERETTTDGLYSFLSAKLPLMEGVYYHPVTESVNMKKPKLVRGGIIADEMGLGKTVVSLALILQNPAPQRPVSGSKYEMLRGNRFDSSEAGWDLEWQLEKGQNPLKASIISRGTLVVCHVSLVSQWIDEAKSKLNDPGLVYAYHGQSRKRDVMVLAENAIIVTTYATLAKDATYHADKAFKNGKSDYCPPCEQIRWWRIICDESHTLKQDTVQTKAVMNLVGDHKWAVSGTPWSTSLRDIVNQLKFVGLEDVDRMFNQFQNRVFERVDEENRRRSSFTWNDYYADDRRLGHFMFLMRAVMIRHAQKQQYHGTSTTLMSLPQKTERTILIDFEPDEATKYAILEKEARDLYRAFKPRQMRELNRHYFKLMQMLTPTRIACAGGRIPLTIEVDNENDSGKDMHQAARPVKNAKVVEADQENDPSVKPDQKKVQMFSKFRFQSKFNVLIEELKKIRDSEPDAKTLVFSQYASSLKFLQEELPKHGFQFRTLTGDMTMKQRAEALHAFKEDPPTTVFLLSMRSGAVGINLTQANRVFLLEPALNPSLAVQAVGRVYRLGQTRHVEVIRLLMKDSIETRISQWVDKRFPQGLSANTEAAVGQRSFAVATAPPVNVAATTPIVGNVRTEKATVMELEFDFLFGLRNL